MERREPRLRAPQHLEQHSLPEFITLARVVRPRGRIGEVAAEILTDFPNRLSALGEVYLYDGTHAPPRPVKVRRCWLSKSRGGQAIFHFEGVNSISEAERIVGCEVQVPLSQRVTLPAGSYFVSDLVGCEVWAKLSPPSPTEYEKGGAELPEFERVGVVKELQPTGEGTPGTPVLAVETPHGELLIPFAEDICTCIDVVARRIEVLLPEGLRELNR